MKPPSGRAFRLVSYHRPFAHCYPPQRAAPGRTSLFNVLIQINISDENSKSGIQLAELDELAAAVAELPRLRLRGLMAILRLSQNM